MGIEKLKELNRPKEEKQRLIRLLCEALDSQTELGVDLALIRLEFNDLETLETQMTLLNHEYLEVTESIEYWFREIENLSFQINNI